jgi:hypothetical protein
MRRIRTWIVLFGSVLRVAWRWFTDRRPRSAGNMPPVTTPEERDALAKMERLLGRDMIEPVYTPRFVAPAQARLRDDELVMGVEINDEATAYPITVLNSREMVNDTVGGVPILATW